VGIEYTYHKSRRKAVMCCHLANAVE